jgi:hypothetical protein
MSIDLTSELSKDEIQKQLSIFNESNWRPTEKQIDAVTLLIPDLLNKLTKHVDPNPHADENLEALVLVYSIVANLNAVDYKTKPEQSLKSIMRRNVMSLKHLLNCVNKILRA